MAGKRRDTGKPLKIQATAARLRQRLVAETAGVTDPGARIGAAADYVRAALKRRPGRADVADEVIAKLTEAGDRILGIEKGTV